MEIDHLVVSARSLAEGADFVEALLGAALAPGGSHATMGTHNRLLSLGSDCYLEVIAIDPEAIGPDRPRWFDLDNFGRKPTLTNWVARCENVNSALAGAPPGSGRAQSFQRGEYRWLMAVPADGCLPFGGTFPGLIEWQTARRPAAALPDRGCRLRQLTLLHPDVEGLAGALAGRLTDPRLSVEPGPAPMLRAEIDTPGGTRLLQ